jgi:hypothetical protein
VGRHRLAHREPEADPRDPHDRLARRLPRVHGAAHGLPRERVLFALLSGSSCRSARPSGG